MCVSVVIVGALLERFDARAGGSGPGIGPRA
jgi:hypothetical protein